MIREERGFTLIELLIVIAIIAILAVAAAPRFMDMQNRSAQESCRGNQAAIDTAIEVWKFNNPTETVTAPAIAGLVGEGMLKAVPVCPRAGAYTISLTALTDCGFNTGGFDHTRPAGGT